MKQQKTIDDFIRALRQALFDATVEITEKRTADVVRYLEVSRQLAGEERTAAQRAIIAEIVDRVVSKIMAVTESAARRDH